jgi:sortase A
VQLHIPEVRRNRYLIGIFVLFAGAAGVVWRTWNVPAIPPLPTPPLPPSAPQTLVTPRPTPPRFQTGDRIGSMEIPRLKLAVPVYEGDDAQVLKLGAGHVPGTALPGAPGNICIAAHRDKFFRALRFIQPRDEILLETAEGPMRFVVDSTSIVNPSDTQVLLPGPHRDLTLVTCYPFFYVGAAPKRFIVHASRVPA